MQTKETPSIYFVLQSRKMWATLIGIVMMIITAIVNKQPIDPDTLVNGIMILVSVYVGAVAVEDGLSKNNANKTTVSTPGGSDVTVIAPSDATPPVQHSPELGRMG